MIKHAYIWKNGTLKTKNLTGMSAIRAKCMECSGFSTVEIKECSMRECALYPFRFGKYPKAEKDSENTKKP